MITRQVLPQELDEDGRPHPWDLLMVTIDTTKGEKYSAYVRSSKEFGAYAGFQILTDEAIEQIRELGYEPILGEVT